MLKQPMFGNKVNFCIVKVMSLFNLYNEIEKEYENLIPLKQEGLVLFHLYQKQRTETLGKSFQKKKSSNR